MNLDIFSQKITPINNYILIGDKTPESEIKSFYLDKLINKGKNKVGKNTTIINYRNTPLNTERINENKIQNIDVFKSANINRRG